MSGIIASALAGAAAGAGSGMATSAKMDYDAELQKQRDDLLSKRAERLQQLAQQFTAGESEKNRGFQGTENALTRGSNESIASGNNAVTLAGQASTAASAHEGHQTTERISTATNASHERISASALAAQREQSKNLQVDADGNVHMIQMKDGKPVAVPVVDEDGDVFQGAKDMSVKEQSRVKVLQALIKEESDILAKAYDPAEKERVNQRIARYTKSIGTILGIEDLATPTPAGSNSGRKPLGAFDRQGK